MTRTRVTCLDCGAEFVRPNGYQGNYCQSCHEAWIDTAADRDGDDGSNPRSSRPSGTPATRRVDDEDADAPSRYGEE
ncbi:hypothetical protein GCM10008995_22250 [Halobellus salinus]|uniref:Small CPxCG-related zinc finger protein n=1 Tax=Halobellus salinus TaxID=931585 RepID=A0A830EPS2_9EURY|nr:hypothetical protein [Halobellus salinus]GGJ11905.1 hypothetical protein GCM10008995_22250 [Halobellus salinus]SMP02948.1 hypothetical protein SAMN06265347_101251 [Halobellus salinus]